MIGTSTRSTRGVRIEKVWHAAALGLLDILENLLVPGIDREEISKGFWHACGAGQRRAAERLLTAGANLDWVPTMQKEQRWMPLLVSGLNKRT
jgi:uncharacterized protein